MKKALIIISIIIGFLLSLQIRSFKKVEFLLERSESKDFLAQLRTLQIANADLREKLAGEQKTFDEMDAKLAVKVMEQEIGDLKKLAGEDAVSGAGIEITLSSALKSYWITDLIAELVSAGAQAVSLNGIRLTERMAGFRDVNGGLVMRRFFLRPPFSILVIGPPKELKQAISQNGGIIDRIKRSTPAISANVSERENIIIQPVAPE